MPGLRLANSVDSDLGYECLNAVNVEPIVSQSRRMAGKPVFGDHLFGNSLIDLEHHVGVV